VFSPGSKTSFFSYGCPKAKGGEFSKKMEDWGAARDHKRPEMTTAVERDCHKVSTRSEAENLRDI